MNSPVRAQMSSDRTTHLSTAGLSDVEAFDYRHSISGDTYRLRIGQRGQSRSEFETTMRTVDGHVLSDFRSTPIVRSRDARSLRMDARPYVKIRQYVSGEGCTVASGENSYRLRGGDIHLIDQSREFTEVCRGGHQYNLLLPHDEIGFDPAKHGPGLSFGLDSPAGKLLGTAFANLFPRLAIANHKNMARATNDLVTLLRTVLEGGIETGLESTVASARVRTVRRLVADNLSDPQLGPSQVVRLVGLSRATVYRDFAAEGGLERYIFRSRLERGFRMLSKSPPQRGVVNRVALEVGFGSIHHFSNAFQEYFQLRPSDVSGLLCDDDAAGKDSEPAMASATVRDGKSFFNVARGIASLADATARSKAGKIDIFATRDAGAKTPTSQPVI